MPSRTADPPAQPALPGYLVAVEGRPLVPFPDALRATVYLLRTRGRARLYGPDGRILLTRGRVVRD